MVLTAVSGPTFLKKPSNWDEAISDALMAAMCRSEQAIIHQSENESKMKIMTALNHLEGQRRYRWPDFISLGYDFGQTMRLLKRKNIFESTNVPKRGHSSMAPLAPAAGDDGHSVWSNDALMAEILREVAHHSTIKADWIFGP
ncbi:hypothetical protein B0J11DRAFT_577823 [Dendryphion nanum]|uniref:Uncharacterized protein n=1 Tax=Dendryphion nanum TaxID=256645 RepID=A0A9P9E1J8_9PLEO|nr:hypothetical protein B0J11DRAFT_577823 [Dendryphion nanum]